MRYLEQYRRKVVYLSRKNNHHKAAGHHRGDHQDRSRVKDVDRR